MSVGYNPNRTPAGSSAGGRFAPGDASRNDAGQVDLTDNANDFVDTSSAIGPVMLKSKTFHHPDGPVTVSVYGWTEATTGGIPFGPDEHNNAALEQYGEDASGTEPVEGIEYQLATATRITSRDGTEVRYSPSVQSTEHPGTGARDFHEGFDWDEHYDPDDYDRDVEMGLKGALDLPRFSMEDGGEPAARQWAADAATFSDSQLDDDHWDVASGNKRIRLPLKGMSLQDSFVAAVADARRVETTMHSDDFNDDEEYVEEVRRAHRLRNFMPPGQYEEVVCRGQESTLD